MSFRPKSTGFTLIEILVVLFIISIVTTIVLTNFNRNQNKDIQHFATNLTQLLTLAQEQAMLQPATLGLVISAHDMYFVSYQSFADDKKNYWEVLDDTILRRYPIPDIAQITLEYPNTKLDQEEGVKDEDEKSDKLQPQLVFNPNGEVTLFNAYIGKIGNTPRYKIIGDEGGEIKLQDLTK